MGANDKVAATFHGGEYTPRTDDVRALYVLATPPHRVSIGDGKAEFNRWLAKVRAEAKAEALREAASAYPVMLRDMVSRPSVAAWLRDRAEQYKDGVTHGR